MSDIVEVPLGNGTIILDREDHDRLRAAGWCFSAAAYHTEADQRRHSRQPRAIGAIWDPITKKQRFQPLGRVVLGVPLGPREQVDHKNGNPLDNRRANLRICTAAENCANRRPRVGKASRFKGVDAHRGKWRARIAVGGKRIELGRFATEQEAAAAYNLAALEAFGHFAFLNAL